jgi:hypothetical protein
VIPEDDTSTPEANTFEGNKAPAKTPTTPAKGTQTDQGPLERVENDDAMPMRPVAGLAALVWTTVWLAGVALWTYLVLGEYVVTVGLNEPTAWLLFLGTIGAVLMNLAQSGVLSARSLFGVVLGALAGLGILVFLVANVFASPDPGEFQTVSLLLLVVSVLSVVVGNKRSERSVETSETKEKTRSWKWYALWGSFAVNTLIVVVVLVGSL